MRGAELIYVCVSDDCDWPWCTADLVGDDHDCPACEALLVPAIVLPGLEEHEVKAATDLAAAIGRVAGDFVRAVGPAFAQLAEIMPEQPLTQLERLEQSVDRVLPKLADVAVEVDEHGHPAIKDAIASIAGDLKRARDGMP